MTTIEIAERMRSLSKQMELLSLNMADKSTDIDDDYFIHSKELHGASLKMRSWAREILVK